MQATVIFNESAGQFEGVTLEELSDALGDAGYQPVCKATHSVDEIDAVLDGATGLVLSAGGDGTAREIALRLHGRSELQFCPLPMGTANNLCRTLGIEGEVLDLVARLRRPRESALDLGRLSAPWGEAIFMEGAGLGFFAEALAAYDPEQGKSMLRSLESLLEVFTNGFARETTVTLPDQTLRGEFLVVEALNTTAVGPHLKFAPGADPTDGLLDVVCIRADQRPGYLDYLQALIDEDLPQIEGVEVFRVPRLRVGWGGFPVHVDGEVHPPGFDYREEQINGRYSLHPYPDLTADAALDIEVIPGAVRLLLPG